ncbi:hypothetical protein Tco_0989787 [Tanacetum coccineum]|uniref:Xylulose kinase-1 n=1 Tax=Tanacetum coccineum TaxID=301880 RepID=A0ABQ5EUL1_9ASTR
MVAYLQKSKRSEGFHQIVDFINTCHIKYALIENPTIYVSLIEQIWQNATARTLENRDMEITTTIDGKVKIVSKGTFLPSVEIFDSYYPSLVRYLQGEGSTIPVESHHKPTVAPSTSQPHHSPTLRDFIRQETKVPQPDSPTQIYVVDEAASIGVEDKHGGAATTVSGIKAGHGGGNIHNTPTMPHDSPILRVHTLGSDEGRMQPNELMELVTKLSNRVAILENDLKQTKKNYGAAFTKLIKKVKTLDKTIKSSKARRRAQFVVSDDEEEDSFNQGRKFVEIDEDPDISLFTALEEVYTAEPDISTANVPVSTAGAEVSIAAESLVYIRRSATKRKDNGYKNNLMKKRGKGFLVFFEDMLKNFDIDDLLKLLDLVRERFSSIEPTDDKKRALWVELKRLRIEQYFQFKTMHPDVNINGNSFKPTAQTTANADGTSTSLISGAVTTEEKA